MPDYFSASGDPVTGSAGESSVIRQAFADIATGFTKVAPYTGNNSKAVIINSGGTGQTVTTGTLTLAGNFATSGAYNLTLALSASVTVTLPATNATMARSDAAQTFTGVQTFSSQPIMSSLTASQAVFTDGSKGLVSNAVTGTGNVVRSASPTFSGTAAFAALSATGQITSTVSTGTAPFVVASTTEVANLKAATATLASTASTASAVALGGITGLGTGVATALGVNVNSAGAFVVLGGALGSPSSVGTLPTLSTNLLFTDATYDIGASGATRPRDFFLSRNATIGGTLGAGATTVTGIFTVSATASTYANFFVNNTNGGADEKKFDFISNGTAISFRLINDAGSASNSAIVINRTGYTVVDVTFPGATTVISGVLDISGASAGNVKFPATQNASADANTLDDYEEGTWTPVIAFGGGSTGVTYSTQSGRYTKIGRVVHISCAIVLTSNGSSTGLTTIEGLPFTIGFTSSADIYSVTTSGAYIQVIMSGTTITLRTIAGASVLDSDVGDTAQIYIGAVYTV